MQNIARAEVLPFSSTASKPAQENVFSKKKLSRKSQEEERRQQAACL